MIDIGEDVERAKKSYLGLYNDLKESYDYFNSISFNQEGQMINDEMYKMFIRWDIATGFSKCVEILRLHGVDVK